MALLPGPKAYQKPETMRAWAGRPPKPLPQFAYSGRPAAGVAEIGVGQRRAFERRGQFGAAVQFQRQQIGLDEFRMRQVGARERSAAQIGADKDRPAQIGAVELGGLEFAAREIGVHGNGVPEIDAGQQPLLHVLGEKADILALETRGRAVLAARADESLGLL